MIAFFYEKKMSPKDGPVRITNPMTLEESRPLNGAQYYEHYLRPNSIYRSSAQYGDQIIYDVTYEYNQYTLRVLPQNDPKANDKHLIFAGCSFVFGEGLDNKHSLPYLVEHQTEGYHTYNWGLKAGGLHKTLHHYDFAPLREYVKQEKGKLYYLFIADHMNRFLASPDFVAWALHSDPYFSVENGEVIFKGRLGENFFYRAFHKIAKGTGLEHIVLRLAATFQSKNDWRDQDFEKFAIGIKFLKERYLRDFPQGEFTFIFHPMMLLHHEHSNRLKHYLTQNDITYIDPSQEFFKLKVIPQREFDVFRILHDGHPNQFFNEVFSSYFVENILERSREIRD